MSVLSDTARKTLLIGVILFVALTTLRLVHLQADTPASLWSGSMGEFVDEGYKTLTPRNLVLFGTARWNPNDDYPGWSKGSPITQIAYLGSFKLLGVELQSARLVSVLSFSLLLAAVVWVFYDRLQCRDLVVVMVLLGITHPLFLFSRLALIEMPLIVAVFLPLLVAERLSEGRHQSLVLTALVGCCIVATLGLKKVALIYFVPILVSFLVTIRRRDVQPRVFWGFAIVSTLIVGTLISLTRPIWSHRIESDPIEVVRNLLSNPLLESSPFLVAAAMVAIAHLLITLDNRELLNPFRLAIMSIAFVSPALVSLFGYHPLRYYIPCLPALILVIAEWLRWQPWKRSWQPRIGPLRWLAGAGAILVGVAACLNGFNRFLLGPIWPGLEPRPGIAEPIDLTAMLWLSLIIGFGLWTMRRQILGGNRFFSFVVALVLLTVVIEGGLTLRFLLDPKFEQRRVASDLEEIVDEGASIAGDWAPFFTIGTPIPSLYMNENQNRVERIGLTRPDYLLSSDRASMIEIVEQIRVAEGVDLGDPVYESSYLDHRVVLYPILYPP